MLFWRSSLPQTRQFRVVGDDAYRNNSRGMAPYLFRMSRPAVRALRFWILLHVLKTLWSTTGGRESNPPR